MASQDWLLD